jgi:hypothetical protein
MKTTPERKASNPLATDALAQAIEAEAIAAAEAVRTRRRVDALLAAQEPAAQREQRTTDLTTSECAALLGCAPVTLYPRSGIAPTRFVGASPRWDLDDARAKLEARGRKPTTPKKSTRVDRDVEVDDVVGRAGLRLAVAR